MNFKLDHEIEISQPKTTRRKKQTKSQLSMLADDKSKLPHVKLPN